jgi:hypothetical protein
VLHFIWQSDPATCQASIHPGFSLHNFSISS